MTENDRKMSIGLHSSFILQLSLNARGERCICRTFDFKAAVTLAAKSPAFRIYAPLLDRFQASTGPSILWLNDEAVMLGT